MSVETSIIELSYADVAVAASLVMIAAAISLSLRLGMERRLAVASLRTVSQLLLIGYVLQWVFELSTLLALLPVILLMLLMAAHTAAGRPTHSYRGMGALAFVSMAVSSLAVTLSATGLIIGVEPWYRPAYLIPLLGMVLGNTMNGVSLALDHFLESLALRRHEVEMELALGATRWEAARGPLAEAIRRGMIPIINSMMVVGIVSLPGMMTGQILSGTDPATAVKYQIMIMFMIAAGAALGSMGIVLLSYTRLFNQRHQLLVERIKTRA